MIRAIAILLSILSVPQLHAQTESAWLTFTRGVRSADEPWYPRWESIDAYQKTAAGPELYEKHFREILVNQPAVIPYACAFTTERSRRSNDGTGVFSRPNTDTLIRKARELCAEIEVGAAHRKPVLMSFFGFSEEEALKALGLEEEAHDVEASWKIFLRGITSTQEPWYPDRSRAKHYVMDPDGLGSYLADLRTVEEETPLAFSYVCAFMVERARRGLSYDVIGNSRAISDATVARCTRAANTTTAAFEQVNTLFDPATSQEVLDRRMQFARFARSLTPDDNAQMEYGAWIPEEFRPEDWGESLTESVYRQRIRATFERDPFLGAAICKEALLPASTRRTAIPRVGTLESIQAVAVDECSALTIERLEEARRLVDQVPVEAYLRAALIPILDRAETLSDAERAARRKQFAEAFPSLTDTSKLQAALETIALDPSDPTGYAAFVAHRSRFPPEGLPTRFNQHNLSALDRALAQLGDERNDAELHRGRAILNLLRGDYAAASAAATAAQAMTRDPRDEMLAGLARELEGQPGSLPLGLTRCTDETCRNFLGTLTLVLRELQPATLLNPDVRDAFIASQRAPIGPDPLRSIGRPMPSNTPLDQVARMISALHAEWLTASKMPDDVRRQSGLELSDTLFTPHGYRLPNRNELVLRLAVRNPSDDKSVFFILEQLQWMGLSEERVVALEHLERFYQERLEETGEIEWQRALRALHYYRGDFQKALEESRQIAQSDEAVSRDIAYLAMTEHLGAGNSRRLDQLLRQCPPATGDEAYWHAGDDLKTHCQRTLWAMSHRLAQSLRAATPRKIAHILLHYPESRDLTSQYFLLGLSDVIDFDTDFAIRELQRLIAANEDTETGTFLEFWGNQFLAEHFEPKGMLTEALGATESALEIYGTLPFDPVDWRRLTTEVNAIVQLDRCCPSTDLSEMVARLARLTMRLGDFEQARYAIESLLWLEMRQRPDYAGFVRTYLADLANAMLDSGAHQGAPQILAYLRTQPTNVRFNEYLDQIELKLTDMVGRSALLPPVAEPWASPQRELERAPLPEPPNTTVS
ncbi:MAG TPA: hypothetical protein VMT00_13145 [Thermoanaerobaculia bacterium]|nr:hypothetical protein [Thermoanaerobaculia bacterium]